MNDITKLSTEIVTKMIDMIEIYDYKFQINIAGTLLASIVRTLSENPEEDIKSLCNVLIETVVAFNKEKDG